MLILVVIIIVLFFVGLLLIFADWLTHLSMTKTRTDQKGWASYKIFKSNFEKYTWDNDYGIFNGSVWNSKNNCEFHANIVKMNGIGMLIRDPISWLIVRIYVKKYIKINIRPERYKWE